MKLAFRSPGPLVLACIAGACSGSIGPRSEGDPSNGPSGGGGSGGAAVGGRGGAAGVGNTGGTGGPSVGGAGGVTPAACNAFEPGPPATRRLTRREYRNAVADLLGAPAPVSLALPGDEQVGTFLSNEAETPSEATVTQYAGAAETLAREAGPRLWKASACPATNATCVGNLLAGIGARAYRRALTTGEHAAYLKLFNDARAERAPEEAFRLVLQVMLQSPHFLYRVEEHGAVDPTNKTAPLTSDSLASRLAFALTGAPADAELVRAAKAGDLADAANVEKQARRLVATARGRETVRDFVAQWLSLDELERTSLDPKLYPDYTPELRAAMQKETADRVDASLANGGDLVALLTAPETVFSAPIGKLYGVNGSAGSTVKLDAGKRAGLFTSPAFLAVTHGAVLRGKILLESVLCEVVPPPPPGTDTRLPALAPGQTPRSRLEAHRADPKCRACHERMDAFGFAFESYDDLGRWRDKYENGAAVDSSGTVTIGDREVTFDGAPALVNAIAAAPELTSCAGKQLFRYLTARVPTEADECTIARAVETFRKKGNDVRELIVALVASPAFTRVTP